jgi:hypothetical protein
LRPPIEESQSAPTISAIDYQLAEMPARIATRLAMQILDRIYGFGDSVFASNVFSEVPGPAPHRAI